MINAIGSIFSKKAIEAAGGVLDNLFTSDEERAEAKRLMQEIRQRPQAAQWEINLAEAKHRSVWVAGWRPAIGWICAASLAAYYIPQFVLASFLWVRFCLEQGQRVAYPADIGGLMELVLVLLGSMSLRTIEKFGKVTK